MKKGNILAIILIVAAVIAGYFAVKQVTTPNPKPSPQTSPSPSPQELKTYQSKDMQITVNVPKTFNIRDQSVRILLDSTEGQIIISREGTQFSTLNSYLEDLDAKNKVQVLDQKDLVIDNYPSKVRTVMYFGGSDQKNKAYIILVNSRVYSTSTSSESLFSDLDQIAQSFRYTP